MAFPSGGPRQNELNFDQIIGQVQQVLGRLTRRFGGGGIGIIVVAILILIGLVWLDLENKRHDDYLVSSRTQSPTLVCNGGGLAPWVTRTKNQSLRPGVWNWGSSAMKQEVFHLAGKKL